MCRTHAAVTAPTHLFDGNVFHPATGVITGSENMLAHLPVTVPVLLQSGNALTVLKAVGEPLFAAHPALAVGLRVALFLYLLALAWRLWNRPSVRSGETVTPGRVFLTTALNPKGAIFAFLNAFLMGAGAADIRLSTACLLGDRRHSAEHGEHLDDRSDAGRHHCGPFVTQVH